MMAKLLIEVRTPGNGKTYEFRIDSNMTVGQVRSNIIDQITEYEMGNITLRPDKARLCNLNTGKKLHDGDTLRASGTRSGQTLLLI